MQQRQPAPSTALCAPVLAGAPANGEPTLHGSCPLRLQVLATFANGRIEEFLHMRSLQVKCAGVLVGPEWWLWEASASLPAPPALASVPHCTHCWLKVLQHIAIMLAGRGDGIAELCARHCGHAGALPQHTTTAGGEAEGKHGMLACGNLACSYMTGVPVEEAQTKHSLQACDNIGCLS